MRDVREIDSLMEHIWLKVVKKEYEQGRILEESNLHSTVYFHLRKAIESSKSKKPKPFIYSEMPFSTTMRGEGKKKPREDKKKLRGQASVIRYWRKSWVSSIKKLVLPIAECRLRSAEEMGHMGAIVIKYL
jgi:hypothetical protein